MKNSYQKEIVLPYSMKSLFDIVKDVDRYHEFLPWIAASSTYDYGKNFFTGRLSLCYQGISQTYQSRVVHDINNQDAFVKALAIDGPFKLLQTAWYLKATDQKQTHVAFYITFEFSNTFYQKIFDRFFVDMSQDMIIAFQKRADVLLGEHIQ